MIIFFCMSMFFFGHFMWPRETAEEIWLPEEYVVVGETENGSYVPALEVDLNGTIAFFPLDEYKKFSDNKTTVIIQDDGMVYYFKKGSNETVYGAKKDYSGEHHKSVREIEMTKDSEIILHFEAESFMIFFIVVISLAVSLVSVLIFVLVRC